MMPTSRTSSPALPRRDFIGRIAMFLAGTAFFGRASRAEADAQALSPYLGEIMLVAFNFAPRHWALCNGQLLPINQNQALFSLLGTQYGGNGQTTFGLPDLRGRLPIHFGQGPGLSMRTIGQTGGQESHTLSILEMPAHAHVARGSTAAGASAGPFNMVPARNAAQIPQYGPNADVVLAPGAITNTGGSQAHPNLQPVLVLNYVIALQGIYPPL